MAGDRKQPIRIVSLIRAHHPQLPEYWTIGEIVIQARLRGLSIHHGHVGRSILRGTGPKIWGTAGSSALLIEPAEASRWIEARLAKRRLRRPVFFNQRQANAAEENFASI